MECPFVVVVLPCNCKISAGAEVQHVNLQVVVLGFVSCHSLHPCMQVCLWSICCAAPCYYVHGMEPWEHEKRKAIMFVYYGSHPVHGTFLYSSLSSLSSSCGLWNICLLLQSVELRIFHAIISYQLRLIWTCILWSMIPYILYGLDPDLEHMTSSRPWLNFPPLSRMFQHIPSWNHITSSMALLFWDCPDPFQSCPVLSSTFHTWCNIASSLGLCSLHHIAPSWHYTVMLTYKSHWGPKSPQQVEKRQNKVIKLSKSSDLPSWLDGPKPQTVG